MSEVNDVKTELPLIWMSNMYVMIMSWLEVLRQIHTCFPVDIIVPLHPQTKFEH
jgi:hypothetical protein